MTWSETLESAELLQQPLSTASSSCLQLCATTGAFDVFYALILFDLCLFLSYGEIINYGYIVTCEQATL